MQKNKFNNKAKINENLKMQVYLIIFKFSLFSLILQLWVDNNCHIYTLRF